MVGALVCLRWALLKPVGNVDRNGPFDGALNDVEVENVNTM